jgi:hypothetical protein
MNAGTLKHLITLQFMSGNDDRWFLSEELNSLKGVNALVRPNPTQPRVSSELECNISQYASVAPDLVNSIVIIIATAGSIAGIASLVWSILKDKSNHQRNGRIEKILVKSESRQVEITGAFSKDEIIEILRASATVTDSNQASKWLRQKQNNFDAQNISQRLMILADALPKYRRLLKLYERDDALEPWQKADYACYRSRTRSLEIQFNNLSRRLRKLQEELSVLQHQNKKRLRENL